MIAVSIARWRSLIVAASLLAPACGDGSPVGNSSSANPDSGSADAGDEHATDAASSLDAASDAAEDPEAGAVPDGGTADGADAALDGAVDAPNGDAGDAPAPHPTSKYCGDGIRDPVLEECDDGPGSADDVCTPDCRVRAAPIVGSERDAATPTRSLGTGPHVASAGDAGFAVVFHEQQARATVALQAFDEVGARRASPIEVSAGYSPAGAPDPALAALPGGGRYAVAWTDGTSGTPDVRLRSIDANSGTPGFSLLAHASTAGSQQAPDILWVGDRLIVAWTDLLDVKWRAFDGNLSPLNDEQKLAASSAIESSVTLSPVSGGWGAAFRANNRGLETIEVRAGGVSWSTAPALPGPAGDRPALVEIDAERLLVVFTIGTDPLATGTASVGRLRAALLRRSSPGSVSASAFEPRLEPYASDSSLAERRPSAVRVGADVYVTWEGESRTGDPLGDELFLARVELDPEDANSLLEAALFHVPRDGARTGPQRNARVGASALFPGGALITVWEDESAGSPQLGPQLMLDFRPVPFVTLAPQGA